MAQATRRRGAGGQTARREGWQAHRRTGRDRAAHPRTGSRKQAVAHHRGRPGHHGKSTRYTGEVEFRDGDYFGRAVNRAARLRSLAEGGQILCSGATAELVIDTLRDDVLLVDLGTRQLKNLARPEHVFELRLETADDSRAPTTDAPMERPGLPAVLAGPGPFVGRGRELEQLLSAWQMTLVAGARAVLIAGEP